MLLCGIIENLETDPGIKSNLGYFFCQATDSRINTATSILAGLIFTLLEQRPALRPVIREKYKDKISQLEGPNAWALLSDIFKDTATSYPVCIVDALDECEHDCKLFLSLVVDTSTRVKWLLSSRNVKDIERRLRSIEPTRRLSLELKENAENVSRSVDVYINNSVRDIEALEDEELQTRTTTILQKKANGTFLWVALVIEQLRNTDRRNVLDVLEEMPEGLESLYNQILKRANSNLKRKDLDACRILLSIITTAERPLHLEELQVFISSQWDQYKATYNIQDIKDIIKDIGSLLSIREDTVYFIHQSVKDYLVGTAAKNIFPSGIEYQHYQMAKISLDAMSVLKHDIYNLQDPSRLVDDITPPDSDPLRPIAYCCVFWVEHLIRGCRSEGLIAFKDDGLLHAFLKVKYLCWLESLALLRSLTLQGADAMHKLKNLAASYCRIKANGYQFNEMDNSQENGEENRLRTFINDAYHFFHSCKDDAKHQPLSLYYSAIVFEDENSAIYRTFRQHTFQQPTCRQTQLGDLTFVKKPPRRLHLQHHIDVGAAVFRLFYSPNSSMLCVLSTEDQGRWTINTISLYRTDTGILERSIKMNADVGYRWASFSADSRHLISVSPRGVVQTLAAESGVQSPRIFLNLGTSKVCTGPLVERVIALSPYGDLVASICLPNPSYGGSVKIWTTQTGACECEIDIMHTSTHFIELHATFAPNSALIVLMHGRGVGVYSVRTGEEMKYIHWQRFSGRSMKYSTFSPDSTRLALAEMSLTTGARSEVYIWCTKTWTKISHITQPRIGACFGFSPDGVTFALASWRNLIIGSSETGQQLLNIATGYAMDNISLSPDWRNISSLAFSEGRAVHIWRADTKDASTEIHNTACSEWRITISPGSKYVAARDLEGGINIWSAESGKCVRMLKRDDSGEAQPSFSPDLRGRPVFSPNCEFFAYTDNKGADVWIWHLKTGKSLHLLRNENRMSDIMIFSDDSKYLIIGYSPDGEVRVWCVKSGKCLFASHESNWDHVSAEAIWPNDSDYSVVSALAISTKSKYLASASRLRHLIPKNSGSLGPEFFAYTRYGSTECHTDEVHIWDWRGSKGIVRFGYAESGINSLAFSSDDTALVTISNGSSTAGWYRVHIWEVATGSCIGSVIVEASYSPPIFDPVTNKILTNSDAFCKGSSWDHWEKMLRPGYSIIWDEDYITKAWICLDGEKIWLIPREFSPKDWGYRNKVAMSASLLAYATHSNGIVIIRFPGQHEPQKLGAEAVDFDEVGDAILDVHVSSGNVSHLAENNLLGEPKAKRLKIS
jgi:WD40 repeat protein